MTRATSSSWRPAYRQQQSRAGARLCLCSPLSSAAGSPCRVACRLVAPQAHRHPMHQKQHQEEAAAAAGLPQQQARGASQQLRVGQVVRGVGGGHQQDVVASAGVVAQAVAAAAGVAAAQAAVLRRRRGTAAARICPITPTSQVRTAGRLTASLVTGRQQLQDVGVRSCVCLHGGVGVWHRVPRCLRRQQGMQIGRGAWIVLTGSVCHRPYGLPCFSHLSLDAAGSVCQPIAWA